FVDVARAGVARRVRPNFLFIGADKSGSTWLFHVLRQHPGCFVPPAKDIYYFDRHYARGPRWYASFFEPPNAATAVGGLADDFLFSEVAAERIHRDLPGVKLIAFLRHPVERTFSEYLYLVRSGLAGGRTFREVADLHPELLDHSRYARHLPAYLDRFD